MRFAISAMLIGNSRSEEESILTTSSVSEYDIDLVHDQSIVLINETYKSWIKTVSKLTSGNDTAEFQIDFGSSIKVHSVMIVNVSRDLAHRIGLSHLRLGDDSTPYSETNPVIFTGIVDGGFFELNQPLA